MDPVIRYHTSKEINLDNKKDVDKIYIKVSKNNKRIDVYTTNHPTLQKMKHSLTRFFTGLFTGTKWKHGEKAVKTLTARGDTKEKVGEAIKAKAAEKTAAKATKEAAKKLGKNEAEVKLPELPKLPEGKKPVQGSTGKSAEKASEKPKSAVNRTLPNPRAAPKRDKAEKQLIEKMRAQQSSVSRQVQQAPSEKLVQKAVLIEEKEIPVGEKIKRDRTRLVSDPTSHQELAQNYLKLASVTVDIGEVLQFLMDDLKAEKRELKSLAERRINYGLDVTNTELEKYKLWKRTDSDAVGFEDVSDIYIAQAKKGSHTDNAVGLATSGMDFKRPHEMALAIDVLKNVLIAKKDEDNTKYINEFIRTLKLENKTPNLRNMLKEQGYHLVKDTVKFDGKNLISYRYVGDKEFKAIQEKKASLKAKQAAQKEKAAAMGSVLKRGKNKRPTNANPPPGDVQ